MDRIRGIGRGASRKVLRRTISNPDHRPVSTQSLDKPSPAQSIMTATYPLSYYAGGDASSYTRDTDPFGANPRIDDGPALSEIAVEEHVPDIITQA